MTLKPVIASYSGEAYSRMKQYLDEPVLDLIARVAQSPRPSQEIPQDGCLTVFYANDVALIRQLLL
jgi:hypothetical protein